MNDKTEIKVIPLTERLKEAIKTMSERIITIVHDDVKEDGIPPLVIDVATALLEAAMDIPHNDEPFNPLERAILIHTGVAATIDAVNIFMKLLRKNRVLFTNRDVLEKAMRESIMNPDRQFIIAGVELPGEDSLAAYTNDVKIIKAYEQFKERVKQITRK